MKETYDDDSKEKVLIDVIKRTYGSNQFEFNEKGIFKMSSDLTGTMEFNYKNDVARKIVTAESVTPSDEMTLDEMPYKFVKGEFHLSMSPELTFILEKVK